MVKKLGYNLGIQWGLWRKSVPFYELQADFKEIKNKSIIFYYFML